MFEREEELIALPADGWCHPDLTAEQQTAIFVAAVTYLYNSSRSDYVAYCNDANIEYEQGEKGEVGKPLISDMPDERILAAFEYGRYWQARQTALTFAGQLGIEGYEHEVVINLIPPVPDDPSSLCD